MIINCKYKSNSIETKTLYTLVSIYSVSKIDNFDGRYCNCISTIKHIYACILTYNWYIDDDNDSQILF